VAVAHRKASSGRKTRRFFRRDFFWQLDLLWNLFAFLDSGRLCLDSEANLTIDAIIVICSMHALQDAEEG
jgi:hypothetical protein